MRRTCTMLLALFISLATQVQAQMPTFHLPDNQQACMGELVEIDVTVENFTKILSCQFTVRWDETRLEYAGVQNLDLPSSVLVGEEEVEMGIWTFSWFASSLNTIDREDDDVLMTLQFTSLVDNPEELEVIFSDSPVFREVSTKEDDVTEIVDAAFFDGMVAYDGPVTNLVDVEDDMAGSGSGSIDIDMLYGAFPFTYEWSNGATTQDISNLAAGTYTLTVTDANGCVTTTEVVVDGVVSTQDLTDITAVELAPNPISGDWTTLYLSLNRAQEVQISLFDLTGKQILTEQQFGSEFALPIVTSQLEVGLYLVQVQTASDVHTLRLLKQ